MVSSPGYHLPSRILQSPPAHQDGDVMSTPSKSRIQHSSPHGEVEMSQLHSPLTPSQRAASPSVFHTPMQEPASAFSSPHATPHRNIASPKPLILASSHRHNFTHQPQPAQIAGNGLLPSLMLDDDPFNDAKVPLPSPVGLPSAFDTTPPVSPAESGKKIKPPPPLFKPSMKLLFSLSTRRDFFTLILPAILFSLAAGLVPPFMTFVLGDAFQVFAVYQVSVSQVMLSSDLTAANNTLKHDMMWVAIKLVILGVAAVTTNTIALAIWLINGERVTMRLRRLVFTGVVSKPMSWFDLGMGKRVGTAETEGEEADEENESSGGLMGRFARETDLARYAIVSEVGRITTCVCTIVACLVVAFWHSYQLTLVILGTVPIIVIVTVVVEVLVTPLMIAEKNITASAAARVERSMGAIATVKAFNAETSETEAFYSLAERQRIAYNRITMLWGFRAGFVQFLLLAMFVTGFWFGNWQVVTGRKSAGDVTIVFWASLLASSNMQMILPMLNLLDKGKVAMAALLETAHKEAEKPASRPTSSHDSMTKSPFTEKDLTHKRGFSTSSSLTPPVSPATQTLIAVQPEKSRARRLAARKAKANPQRMLKKIHPNKFSGELVLKDVTFWYPSRPAPAPPALDKVSLYLPAQDTTYIVGGSGSGKSTVGSLLLNLYKPDLGSIEADEQGIEWLDEHWLRGHIGMVSQGASVIFEGTVHDNVALGIVGSSGGNKRRPEDVSREEVIDACRAALFHDFVRDLPDGYDTVLSGEKGASLSGGQRQRLAIARAYIRDPTVLILDEATSALDLVSRSLIHDAIKRWRKAKTTIIITHDLSPITAGDFVYVMREGKVVEEGYRQELEAKEGGWFRQLANFQAEEPVEQQADDIDEYYEAAEVLNVPELMVTPPRHMTSNIVNRLSASPAFLGGDLREYQQTKRRSQVFMEEQELRRSLASSAAPSRLSALQKTPPRTDSLPVLAGYSTPPSKTPSRQSMIRSTSYQSHRQSMIRSTSHQSYRQSMLNPYANTPPANSRTTSYRQSGASFGVIEKAGLASSHNRPSPSARRAPGARESWHQLKEVVTHDAFAAKDDEQAEKSPQEATTTLSIGKILRIAIPEIPSKARLIIGLLLCIGSGVCTPFFSNQFALLLSGLGNPGAINLTRTALILLLIAFVNGLADWGKYTILQHAAMGWIMQLQERCFSAIIAQDKAWFDDPANAPINLVSMLVKDTEDARNLIGYVVGNILVILSMVFMGLIWAFVEGWQLTLVGLAMGPLFALSAVAGSVILGKYERINKAQREDCAKKFYQSVVNVKAIRSMSLEPVFLDKFETSLLEAYKGGKKSAFFTGFGTGIAYFTIYAAQAVMFFVGAIFITRGWYTFTQVMTVFVLLIFTVTFSTQVIQNIPQVTKAKYAASDLFRLNKLSFETSEAQGKMTFPISGSVVFDRVNFSYPSRPDVPVLQNVSFEVKPGECVGIVGPSGSGKSTVAALLQRLYEPAEGVIRIDGRPLPRVDVRYLRDHVAVVSQHPALFDMSIEDNIKYGSDNVTFDDIVRAARAAHLHDFIMTLPEQYKTHLGESAGLISGGQAQRLQIARALLRSREILLGDEITSALDAENQEAVMKTIMDVKRGRTTILVTHKVSVMKACDRLIVVENGKVVQQGSYDLLIAQKGSVFATLATAGEIEHT